MPYVDPKIRFWIGIVVTVAIAVSNGTLVLTNIVPHDWIPYVTAWCGLLSFTGSSALTALNGAATTTSSRIASAAADPNVAHIVTTPAIANSAQFTSDEKVVAPTPPGSRL